MPRPRRSLFLLIPAAVLFLLACWLAGRFWLAPDPQVPSFSPAQPVAFPGPAPALPADELLRRCHGRILRPGGAGVAGALVYARVAGRPYWAWSDEGGDYELTWPMADAEGRTGEVSLSVAAFGHPPTVHRVPALGGANDLTLAPSEEAPLTPPVAAGSDLRGSLDRPGAVREGRPFAYEVVLTPTTPPETFGAPVARRAACDGEGSFVFEDLTHGAYRVQVLPSWARGGSWPDVVAGPSALLEHPAADGSDVRLALAYGALHGTTLDVSGAVVEGALVIVTDGVRAGRLWPPAASDATGGFDVLDLPPGSYRVAVRAGEADVREVEVEVTSGARNEVPVPPLELRSDD